jgi:hypothetical protein
MATPQRLSSDALASELAKLPDFSAPTSTNLDAVRIAIARAVASGQSADQIAADLGAPAAWQGIDFSRTAQSGTGSAAPSGTSTAKALPASGAPASVPDWIGKTVPLALAKDITTRVVVLDREPTALGGLEGPAWARALKPAAIYGPVALSSPGLQVNTSKFIITFVFTETVEFVRSGNVLCVLPLSIFHFGSPNQASIVSGSAWIAVNPFDASAPAGSFAGVTVQSGQVICDQPITISAGVATIPAAANLGLSLAPAPQPAGPNGFPATVTAPSTILITFPASGAPTISCGACAATLYGEQITCAAANHPPAYNSVLKLMYVPGTSSAATFTPASSAGKLIALTGSAPIESAGWALSVSESTTPATLGTAAGPGDFAIAFGAGISAQWAGMSRAELAAGGVLVAQNAALLLALISGSPKGVLLQQSFELWIDQASPNQVRCRLLAARAAGQALIYALAGSLEILELGAVLEALVDRPVLASGARVAAVFTEGIVLLERNAAGHRLVAYSAAPSGTGAHPLALDNALLEVSEPTALYLVARTDADFNATSGLFYLLFAYLLVELYLPDPYTGSVAFSPPTQGPPTTFEPPAQGGSAIEGFLLAAITWTTPANATLRLSDTAHAHPTAPPSAEADSTAVPPPRRLPILHVLEPVEKAIAPTGASSSTELEQHAAVPTPDPLPAQPAGAVLMDLSTRASQLGVEVVTGEREDLEYTIDGLSVRGPSTLLPLTTLPAIAWEPMYDLSTAVDAGVNDNELLHPPDGDGPFSQVRCTSGTLIPISPLQSLQAVLDAGTGGFTAQLTLPFGMVGALDSTTQNGTILPELTLIQPVFPAAITPAGTTYTGAWQISIAAPNPTDPDPVLAGRTYLRTQNDNPPAPSLSYGEMVLGTDVKDIFSSRFDPPTGSKIGTGVPLRRYDLTGYGASTFSEWTNTAPAVTDVIKAHFHVLVGRTSHEVIQVQSLIYPWAIKVVRTITIDRQGSGVVQRYDSGWQAASEGVFAYPAATGITANEIHAGVIGGVINVKNIQELGFPVNTEGTPDIPDTSGAKPMAIPVQPVTFDADVIIQPQHEVVQGGSTQPDLTGVEHTVVPSTGVTGFIGLQYDYHLSLVDMAGFSQLSTGAGGPINATIMLGGVKTKSLLRATEFDATPVNDTATSGLGIVGAVRGIPKLSSDGSWSVAARTQQQQAPVALPPNAGAPVVQPNKSGTSTPDVYIHYANPADLFRLASGSTTPPETLYGFMQSTGTQSNILSRPILTAGSPNLTLGDALNVAHAGALLGAISSFPGISNCLQFLSSELEPITNQLEAPSLSTTQNLWVSQTVRAKPVPLITTSIADVNLYFYPPDSPMPPAKPATPDVQITLGSPTPPSWSLAVNNISIGLVIPALGNTPVIWFVGGFTADADTTPAFPNLQTQFDTPLKVLATLFTILNDIASVLSPGGSSSPEVIQPHDSGSSNSGLQVNFSDGKLSVSDDFTLPSIPLGLGQISNISLDIGTTLDILGLEIDFLVGIGSPTAPCQWTVDPLSGTICVQAGIQNNAMDILIQAGIGLGLAINLGIASGSASITIAVQLQINGSVITIMLLLTGQAQVDVLGGLASASITLTAGLGFTIDAPADEVGVIGTASVGIHISICWIINISFSGSWTFQKQLPFHP